MTLYILEIRCPQAGSQAWRLRGLACQGSFNLDLGLCVSLHLPRCSGGADPGAPRTPCPCSCPMIQSLSLHKQSQDPMRPHVAPGSDPTSSNSLSPLSETFKYRAIPFFPPGPAAKGPSVPQSSLTRWGWLWCAIPGAVVALKKKQS